MRAHAYLNNAVRILSLYDGRLPLAAWLKQYFRQEKKFGSRDRKMMAHLLYSYFRLGHALKEIPVEERMLTAAFLATAGPDPVVTDLKPEWSEWSGLSTAEKIGKLGLEERIQQLFPWTDALSPQFEKDLFLRSHLVQPDLFLRIRPGQEQAVARKLEAAGIPFERRLPDCLALPNGSKVEEVLQIDREVVIQDFSSQQVLAPLGAQLPKGSKPSVWDCCAASGGKSLLMADRYPGAGLTVSDIRSSIIHNLRERFVLAGLRYRSAFVGDVGAPGFKPSDQYDVVICDAPCSGSGTWGRTPEQLYFFTEEKIAHYTGLQARIALNAAWGVKPGGYLLYITCSVFSAENERMVEKIGEHSNLRLLSQQYFKGYEAKADSLFVALFQAS